MAQVGQCPGCDFGIEARQFHLGGADRLVDDSLRVGNPDGITLLRRRADGAFVSDRPGRFVRAQAVKNRMAHHALARHLRIGHFTDQLGFEPVRAAHFCRGRRLVQRATLHHQRFELGVQAFQRGLVETGADLAGVAQFALFIVQAEQQCAEPAPRPLGVGEADDDELLPVLALDLHPTTAAPGDVAAAGALADQPFELHLAGALQDAVRLFGEVGGKAQQIARPCLQNLTQCRPAFFERHFAQVHAVQIRQVEQVENDAAAAAGFEGVLQRLEIRRALLVGHHHLAVEPGGFQPQRRQRLCLLRHLRRPVMAVAGEQPHLARLDSRQDAVTVEFDLVAPVAIGHRLDQRRQLRLQAFRQRRRASAGKRGGRFFCLATAAPRRCLRRLGCGFGLRLATLTWDQGAVAEHAVRLLADDVVLAFRPRRLVVGFDQEPLLLVAVHPRAHQVPAS